MGMIDLNEFWKFTFLSFVYEILAGQYQNLHAEYAFLASGDVH